MTEIAHTTWIVIPAYNEQGALSSVINRLSKYHYRIVVVDDCSTDETAESLRGLPVYVCRHPINLGQGAAIQTGISFALKNGAQFLVTFDGDGQHHPDEIERLLAPLRRGEADVALGSRFLAGGSAVNIPPRRRFMLKMATWFTRITTHLALTDTHNGFRALTAEAARKLRITQNRMAHASQILAQIHEEHLRYVEVPVTIEYSAYSLAKGQKMSNSFNIVWESFTEIFRR